MINKIDTVKKDVLLSVIAAYTSVFEFAAVVPISARKSDGVDTVKAEIEKFIKPGPQYFPEDMVTDQPQRQIAAEIIREKLLRSLNKEVPHGIAIEIFSFEESASKLTIEANIYCEKQSHKGIIIGKQGSMLKRIGTDARREIEEFLQAKVNLKLWVKVKKDWRDSDFLLKNFGYKEKD